MVGMNRVALSPVERFEAKRQARSDGCIEWTAHVAKDGYGKFTPYHGLSPQGAHRYAWELVNGIVPDGVLVLHRCDNRICVNVEHLFLGTHRDNVVDMISKGRQVVARGPGLPQSKLTPAKVRAMRRLRARAGLSYAQIGRRFHVARSTARRACVGIDWKHV